METGDGLNQVYLMKGGSETEMRRALARILPAGSRLVEFSDPRDALGRLAILPERIRLSENAEFSPGITVIVSSEEHGQLEQLAHLPAGVITCGLSSKDTVTFSSRLEDRAVVSLLRSLEGARGTIEPMDLPVCCPSGCGAYPLLAAAAAKIFLEG